jgi:hypothetical protein
MTDVEQWEPSSVGNALETLDRVRAYLAQAEQVEDVSLIRDQGEAMAYWARERNMGRETEMIGQEIARRAERKLGELAQELRETGRMRGGGRPRKETAVPDKELSEETAVPDKRFRAADIFDSTNEAAAAAKFATIDEDTFAEAMAGARESGDITRKGLIRQLRNMGVILDGGRADNGDSDITPIGRVMAAVFRNLAAVVERLQEFDPATIEHDDRKEWRARLTEYAQAIDAWRKALPR